MCIFFFLKIYNVMKGIMHIYIVFLQKVNVIIFHLITCSDIYILLQNFFIFV